MINGPGSALCRTVCFFLSVSVCVCVFGCLGALFSLSLNRFVFDRSLIATCAVLLVLRELSSKMANTVLLGAIHNL